MNSQISSPRGIFGTAARAASKLSRLKLDSSGQGRSAGQQRSMTWTTAAAVSILAPDTRLDPRY
jgi:hypothetical protein